ncbi:putative fatty acid elongation protein [Dirofilaria immitis]
MYAYYSITAWGIRLPKLLSMCVTVLQTSQMLIGVSISILALKQKLKNAICQQSMDNLALGFAIYSSFAQKFENPVGLCWHDGHKRFSKKLSSIHNLNQNCFFHFFIFSWLAMNN